MNMIPVKSSNIAAIGHDPTTRTMRIEYKNGIAYDYSNVTRSDYKATLEAPSIGSHIHKHIKPKYPNPTKLTKHETTENRSGYLVESIAIITNNPIKSDAEVGHCPACQEEAAGFDPPMQDYRYVQRLQQEKEINNLETDEEAHLSFLKASGGYIETCGCGVSFWVPFDKARLKTS